MMQNITCYMRLRYQFILLSYDTLCHQNRDATQIQRKTREMNIYEKHSPEIGEILVYWGLHREWSVDIVEDHYCKYIECECAVRRKWIVPSLFPTIRRIGWQAYALQPCAFSEEEVVVMVLIDNEYSETMTMWCRMTYESQAQAPV